MTKKSSKKNRVKVPKLKMETSNDIYMHRKGQAKRKQSLRRMKEIMKHIVVKENKEDVGQETTETVSFGQEGEDIQLGGINGGTEHPDGVRAERREETDNNKDSKS